ncbi:MAG TPA: carboxypeptidase regulatory-like domain-containing protein [Terriglobales bacterium]|nr:carboxypeptidase regulatory-like domain-containing protein [Terriglobales bacterium]
MLLPDTQFYSESYPDIFGTQTRWIRDNIAKENIKFVIGLGDIVNQGNSERQWQNANAAYLELDGRVPYMAGIGNNDYDGNAPQNRSATNFNRYFGPSRYAGYPWYQGNYNGSNENFYTKVNVGGRNYLILMLEFAPRNAVLNWAESIIAANPSSLVIVATHAFLFTDNTRLGKCDPYDAGYYGLHADNDADEMWQKMIRKYGNVIMVLSGHIGGVGTARRMDVGENGNGVHQILTDYQTQNRGGDGFLRLLRIKPSLNQVDVVTYSPYINQYKTDPANQWTMPFIYKTDPKYGKGLVKGYVRNASDCTALANVQVASSEVLTTTNPYGAFTLSSVTAGLRSFTAYREGWTQQYQMDQVTDSMTSQLNFFLSPVPASSSSYLEGRISSAVDGHFISAATVSAGGKSTASDSAGYYRLTLPEGTYSVTVSNPGWLTRTMSANVPSSAGAVLNVAISTAGIVRGTVMRADGTPISGAKVTLTGGVIYTTKTLVTNSAGYYSSNWTAVGSYNIQVSASGFQDRVATAKVSSGVISTLDFVMAAN